MPMGLFSVARRWLAGEAGAGELAGTRVETADSLSPSYTQKLLKSDPPVVLPIRPENLHALERHLFDGSYKGVTDLVTKWVWPRPARWVTGILAGAAVRPNVVTLVGLGLVVAVAGLFAIGQYGFGLLLAWTMTFLDTVDGKLARVTISSTPLGHILDHGTDIVHPPFWYIAWGYGLAATPFALDPPALRRVLLTIVVAYVLGRLIEGAFNAGLAKFSMFSWRPVDSYFRLIMARRNPNLLLLSAALIAGRPDWGLIAVAAWTVASTAFLAVRLTMAVYARVAEGPLRPWLAEIRAGDRNVSAVARPFARQAFEPDFSLLHGVEVSAVREGRRQGRG